VNLFGALILMVALFTQNSGSTIPTQQSPEKRRQEEEAKRQQIVEYLRNASEITVVFQGNHVFTSQKLYEQMQLSRDSDSTRPFALKTPTYFEYLQDDLERIRFFLGSKGFLQARYSDPEVQVTDNQARVILRIEEGALYRIGKLEVIGNRLFSAEHIIAISGLKTGEPANVQDIQEKLYEGIKREYGNHGYIQAETNFNPAFKLPFSGAPMGIVDVKIEVDEGRLFTIRSIGFRGAKKGDEELLRSQLFLREGDILRHNLIEESIKAINRLNLYAELREKDLIIRTRDLGSEAEIQIQLQQKNAQ
jgi:outer membrane protein insertion porin family